MRICILYFIILVFASTHNTLSAQSLLGSASINGSNETGSFSGSIGECFISETANETHSIVEGFQQPTYGLSTQLLYQATGKISIKISPNPVLNQLLINLDLDDCTNFSYSLYNMYGKLIHNSFITNKQTYIDFINLPKSSYLLKINQKNRTVFTTTLIKN